MQPSTRVIRVYSDRELLGWALERIACQNPGQGPGFKVIRESAPGQTTGNAEGPSAIVVDSRTEVFELIRKLSGQFRGIPIVVWQRSRANEPSLNALEWGAAGVLHDHSSSADILNCLEAVTNGRVWIPDSIAQAASRSRRCHLSRREGQLLGLVVQGLRNKEIAHHLSITEGTVKVYFSRLFQKLGVADRYELALLGLRHSVPDVVLTSQENSQPGTREPLKSIFVNRVPGFESTFAGSHMPSHVRV